MTTMRKAIGVSTALLVSALVSLGAQSSTSPGALSTPEGGGTASVSWTRGPYAAAANPTPQVGGVPASCVEGVTCATVPLTIDLPADYWTRHNGSLTITLEWPDHRPVEGQDEVFNDFDVYLYDADGREVTHGATNNNPESLIVSDPRPGTYSVIVYLFSVIDEGFTAVATLQTASGARPTPVDDDSKIEFSAPVTLTAPGALRDGEPSTAIDRDGRWYVGAIRGVPAGSDMWIITDPSAQQFKWLGRPDTFRVQDAATGEFREPTASDGGGDMDFALSEPTNAGDIPRIYMSSLAAATVSSAVSEDTGKTWLLNPSATLATTEDRQWNIAAGQNYAAIWVREPITGPGFYLYQSIDGGKTYPAVALVYPMNGTGGQPVINPATGTVYGVISSGTNLIFVKGTRDPLTNVVTTFTNKVISSGFRHNSLFPVIKIDTAGNLYVAWSDITAVYYRYSLDDGATWSAPIVVSRGRDNASAVMPWMSVGDPGRLAFAWYGSSAPTNTDSQADWYLWFSQTINGLDAEPTFVQQRAVQRIIHRGNVSLGGLNATDPNLNRNLIDFFQTAVDPEGRVVIAFTDDHNDFDGHTYVTRQISGPTLYADSRPRKIRIHPRPRRNGPEVDDFDGDTQVSPSTTVPAPAFDILSIDYAQEEREGQRFLVATMKLKDLSSLPNDGSWRAYFSVGGEVPDKGTRFFVEATTDLDVNGGAPAFLYGSAGRLNSGAISDSRLGEADGGSIDAASGTIVMRLSLGKIGNPAAGTLIHGTMGRARAALENSRLVLDRTRGGTGFTLK
jgi:hypothetical protein